MSELSKQALKVDNNQSFPNNNTGYITPSRLRDFNVNMIDSLVDEVTFNSFSQSVTQSIVELQNFSSSLDTNFASQTEFNSYTASNNSKVNSLIAATASYATSAITASSLVTASFDNGTRNLTFTKGDASTFNVNIPDVSGSAGDFVTTSSFNAYTASTNSSISNLNSATQSLQSQLATIGGQSGSWITESETGSFATTGSNTFVGDQTISASLNVSGSTNVGFLNIADNGGINLVGTGSIISSYGIVTNPSNGDLVFNTNPNNGRLMTFSATDGRMTQFNGLYFNAGDSSSTNGGIAVSTYSGSLFLTPSGFSSTTASMLHISSSSNINNVNLIFKNSNTAADTIVSGSNNIFTNPVAATAGFKRYVGGTSNIFTNGNSVPQISGSMTWSPSMNGNIFSHTQTNALTFRGAVSSSVGGGINHNIFMGGSLNLGTSAANNFEKALAGVTVVNNAIFGGTINMVAKDTILTNASAVSANLLFGSTLNLNLPSSSVTYASNIQNGIVTLNNSFLPISGTVTAALSPRVTLNTVYGHQHVINMSGSNVATNQSKTYYANILAGMFLSSSMTSNSDANHILATGLLGNSLIVTGSSTAASMVAALTPDSTQGTVIVGRFNDGTGTKASTAETVFAVGTGNTTTRKTGFLIDSGSNTFVEGTLNVSGSTSLTGSLTIQSGSAFFANGNRQFNVGAFQSGVSQSGSANVSQSMNFETTDISSGVSIASNSRITLANSGTYNIQFSAQLLADTGADDVYIWLKKNGVNVTASAGHVVLANNEELIAAWNYVVDAAANDYYEIGWQSTNGDAILLAEPASGNIPSIPSIILTVTQVR